MLRLLESFFRRWWLYLVPVVLLGLLGFMSVSGTKKKFQSSGTFNVESSTILSNLSGDSSQTNGFDTPAGATSKRINATLGTDQFIKDVATRAGIAGALANGTITPGWIRSSLSSTTNGSNLVRVVAVNEDPQVAQRLAAATIDAFIQSTVDSAAGQSTAAVAFFDGLIKTYQTDVDTAQAALDDYVTAHPAPAIGTRPEDESAEITRLTADLNDARTNYNTTVGKRQDAQLSVEQAKADIGERMRLIDAPQVPVAPQARLKSMVMGFGTFLAAGIVLSIATVVIATLMNHSVQTAADVKDRLGLTSAISGEGVTFITRALALVLTTDVAKRVCLVDLNWWTPSDWPGRDVPGVAEVVRDGLPLEQALHLTGNPGLHVLPAGTTTVAERPAVARCDELAKMLDELNEEFEYVLLDLPAVHATSEALTLAENCPSLALVVGQNVTPESEIKSALEEVDGVPLLGVILNRSYSKIPRFLRNRIPGA